MKIQIHSIHGSLLFEGDFSSLIDCVLAAIRAKASESKQDANRHSQR